jgi:7,8-dihydroneopterin aldolase/epimerase/oxygenase
MYTVYVRGLEVYAYHGVPAEERVLGHRYSIDFELIVDGASPDSDSIHDTVDYSEAAKLVESTVLGVQGHTLERLCELVAERLLDTFPAILEATVTIEKPMPPMPLIAAAAGVSLTRSR